MPSGAQTRLYAAYAAFSLTTALAANPAQAGAWPQTQGRTSVIARLTTTTAPHAFDAGGQVVGEADFEKLNWTPIWNMAGGRA